MREKGCLRLLSAGEEENFKCRFISDMPRAVAIRKERVSTEPSQLVSDRPEQRIYEDGPKGIVLLKHNIREKIGSTFTPSTSTTIVVMRGNGQ